MRDEARSAGSGRGGGPVRWVRVALRSQVGLWVLHEARNRLLLGRRTPALRRFETAEVRRLAPAVHLPEATFAVVVPTFRRPRLVREAVGSVLAQTFGDLVVIVVDDGGGELPDFPADPRLAVVSLSRNTGVPGVVRNIGLSLTRSRFVAFLDDDNRWTPDHLAVGRVALDRGAELAYTAVGRFRPDGSLKDVLSEPFDRRRLADEAFVDTSSVVARRTPGLRFSRLPRTRATLPGEDWEFVRRQSRGRRVEHMPAVTVRYLVHDESHFTDWSHDSARPG